jgi:hypothetical protein
MKTRRTEVTIEVDEVWIIRRPDCNDPLWCPACSKQTTVISPANAALLTGLKLLDIYRLIETGRIHRTAMAEETVLVCFTSLMKLNAEAG